MILEREVHDVKLDSSTGLDLDRVDAIQTVAVVIRIVRRGQGTSGPIEGSPTRADELSDSRGGRRGCGSRHGCGSRRSGSSDFAVVVIDDVGSPEATPRDTVVGQESDQHLVSCRNLNRRQGGSTETLSGGIDVGRTDFDAVVSAACVELDVHVEEGQCDLATGSTLDGKEIDNSSLYCSYIRMSTTISLSNILVIELLFIHEVSFIKQWMKRNYIIDGKMIMIISENVN